ncbi:hypothetical protein [Alistipes finegoldii]|uniref:hypothetical protein n=1 Tax=Alistipes finegoldii TaxID=214856 RepID=UPI00242D9BCB|nr:hypothetical protein [Alistipes finegoldii]
MAKENNNKSFVLRIDAATMEALEGWAADEFRSINGQLQWIIADALRRSGRLKKPRPAGLRSGDSAGLSPDNDAEVKAGDSFGGRPDDVAGMRPDESVAGRSGNAVSATPPVPPRSDHSDDM